MKIIETEKKPIKLWLDDIEEGALQQAKNIANLPFVHQWVAIMPDSHQGYGMPIGGVVGLINVISPNMVGVDIGCGMCAVNTHIKTEEITQDQLKQVLGIIRDTVPVGFAHHQEKQDEKFMPEITTDRENIPISMMEYEKARTQIGTLGGGNHFIELQKSDNSELWIMIHSGSRNLGKTVCDYYNNKAIELAKKYYIPNVVEQDLAYLPTDAEEGKLYIEEMKYCVSFAFANRKLMMDRVQRAVVEVFPNSPNHDEIINIAHNYAQLENHMGKNVWVHRKGATSAREGEIGIIPGSMGTKSYIVKGRGNKESFTSCSHGAGRLMSRTKASEVLTEDIVNKSMEGVVFGRWNKGRNGKADYGEAPGAYKDIDTVMQNQADLVEVLVELKPLAVVKG